MTHKRLLASLAVCAAAVFTPTASAQEAHHPQISIVHSGIGRLKSDIKLMMDLATEDQQWWDNWDTVIDLFAFGLDYERPVLIEVLSGLVPAPTMIFGPYEEPVDDLLYENLEGADFVPQKVTDTLYNMLEPERGWFRVLPNVKYAILVLSTEQNHDLLKQLILKAADPTPVIDETLAGNASMGVRLVNKATTTDDQEKRRASFQDIRAERMSLLARRPDETETEFAVRKGIVSIYLDELERLLVESARARSQTFLQSKTPDAKVTFEAEAIDGTSFADTIAGFNQTPDAFGSVAVAEGSALSLRINHPIDEMRQESSNELIALIRADVEAKVASDNSQLSQEQQTATLELFDGVMAVVKDGIASGNLNAFVESVTDKDNNFSSWGGSVAVEPRRLEETLKLVSRTGEGNEAETNIDQVDDTKIHRIKLREGFLKIYDDVFGAGAEVYIATSDNMVWFATGTTGLDSLKSAISELKEPVDNDVVLQFDMQLRPWVQKAKKIADSREEPSNLDDQQALRELKLRLNQAVESLHEDDDDLTFHMQVADGVASGNITVQTGLLRFIGSQLEDFSRNSLQ